MSIIDDVIQNVTKEVNKVQERGQEMFQSFNLKSQIGDLERKKGAKLTELGRLIVDKYHHNKELSEESIKEKVSEVVGYDDQINILQAELDQIKTANDPAAPTAQRAEAKAGFKPTPGYECPRCHAPASKDRKFCPACGETLGGSGSSGSSKPADEKATDDGPLDVEAETEGNGDHK
ncbi:MAG TPA: zinc ribbon domain-containing protein [Nitrososphaera sp.]|nr:zinc ribbon domain-containing protein [Nitrososphaera sp.]